MHGLEQEVVAKLQTHAKAADPIVAAGSRTNAAQRAKQALEADPFNLDLVGELGACYAAAGHWQQCRNVMLRGRDRLREIVDDTCRHDFALLLCEAQYQCGYADQAVSILREIEEPRDAPKAATRARLACRVYCAAKDKQRGLKEFCRAIDGTSFDEALRTWALAQVDLQRVGALSAAKDMMERLADGDDTRLSQLGALEDLVENGKLDIVAKDRLGPLLRHLRTLWATLPLRLERQGAQWAWDT